LKEKLLFGVFYGICGAAGAVVIISIIVFAKGICEYIR